MKRPNPTTDDSQHDGQSGSGSPSRKRRQIEWPATLVRQEAFHEMDCDMRDVGMEVDKYDGDHEMEVETNHYPESVVNKGIIGVEVDNAALGVREPALDAKNAEDRCLPLAEQLRKIYRRVAPGLEPDLARTFWIIRRRPNPGQCDAIEGCSYVRFSQAAKIDPGQIGIQVALRGRSPGLGESHPPVHHFYHVGCFVRMVNWMKLTPERNPSTSTGPGSIVPSVWGIDISFTPFFSWGFMLRMWFEREGLVDPYHMGIYVREGRRTGEELLACYESDRELGRLRANRRIGETYGCSLADVLSHPLHGYNRSRLSPYRVFEEGFKV